MLTSSSVGNSVSQPNGGQNSTADFSLLLAQCRARVKASVHKGGTTASDSTVLAERLACIVSSNRARGRVPHDAPPATRSGVPDGYIDEVLFFLNEEGERLNALRTGDEATWRDVLALSTLRAYGYLLRAGLGPGQARQLADDFAQKTAVTLWEQALESYPYDTHFDAWVSRIVAYEVSQWRRSGKEKREQHAISLDAIPTERLPGPLYEALPDRRAVRALDDAETRLMLEEALTELPTDEQRQTVLRQLAGQTNKEIAESLGRTPQAVYNLRHRALRTLRHILGHNANPSQSY